MEKLITNYAIRIRPPSLLTKNKWLVEHFDKRKMFHVPEITVYILLYCVTLKSRADVIQALTSFHSLPISTVEILINHLIKLNILLNEPVKPTNENNSNLMDATYNKWCKKEWGAAAEYHFYTYNYHFLDYSETGTGWEEANCRMNEYSDNEPDINRVKRYESKQKINFQKTETLLEQACYEKDLDKASQLNLDILSKIAAFGFAKTAEAPIRWKGEPLIRRTSPSGGSRHPTEGYILAFNVTGLEEGIYHIQSDPFCFTQLQAKEVANSNQFFPELFTSKKNSPCAIILLSSVFDRNMFRYRDPRTFRTIHMDAGHILGTLELVIRHFNLRAAVTHAIDINNLERLIQLDGLTEGILTSIGIFNTTNE